MAISSDIGLSLLGSMGANRFDVANMSKVLANADVSAQRINLEEKQKKLDTLRSGYDLLQRALQGFNSQVGSLMSPETFDRRAVSVSDESVMKATATGKPITGSYQIEVQQLASAHTLATAADFASPSDQVGTGTLKIASGGVEHTFTIDSSNNTLEGIRDAVNAADIGVSATIVNTGQGYRLMFAARDTGAANAITITVSGDGDGNDTDSAGLSQLINANMTETAAAQDARIAVNGLVIERETNRFDDVIEGVQLDLRSAAPGVTQTLVVQQDTSDARQAVQDFVDLYNSLQDIFKLLGDYDNEPTEDEPAKGALKGDSTLRLLKDQVRQMIAQSLTTTDTFQSLAEIGITTQLDGKLQLDTARLEEALATDAQAVGKLFGPSITAADPGISYLSHTDKTPEGTWSLYVSQAAEQAEIAGSSLGGTASDTITLDDTNNTLEISVDGTASNTLTLATGTYTRTELAQRIETAINRDSNIAGAGGKVSVQYDATNSRFVIRSEKYGAASEIDLTGGSLLSSVGWTSGDKDNGVDVGGQISANGKTYTFVGEGQTVQVGDFDFVAQDGLPAGLSFKVEGSQTGDRGTFSFSLGVAERLTNAFQQWMDSEGILGQRLETLSDRQKAYEDQQKKIDARYEALELRYRLQFGRLQGVLDSMKQTQSYLAAQLTPQNSQQ